MKPGEFVAKWSKLQQKETALYASHFGDVCRLVGHDTPAVLRAYGWPDTLSDEEILARLLALNLARAGRA